MILQAVNPMEWYDLIDKGVSIFVLVTFLILMFRYFTQRIEYWQLLVEKKDKRIADLTASSDQARKDMMESYISNTVVLNKLIDKSTSTETVVKDQALTTRNLVTSKADEIRDTIRRNVK